MMSFNRPKRVWVNQPSTLQKDHDLHGKRGIAIMEKYDAPDCLFVTVYFTDGKVISQRMDKNSLSLVGEAEGNSDA